jgi:Zn-dependent peptidase ImmA (M78 family)/DNA-binding XRE family transcriptional regulator
MLSELEARDPRELGERLRAARSKAGLTQEEAARALDLARTTVVALEKGQRRVRPEEFRAMAELYHQSVNALLRPGAVHVDLAPRFRALAGASESPAAEATRLLGDLASAEVELERLVGQPLRPNYPPERPILPGDVREQAEDAAAELRHRLGLGSAPIADVVSLLELELGIRVFVRPLPSGSISGLFVYDDDLGACVLLNRNHPRTRRALTAAHELGHLVSARRQPGVVDLASGPQSREEKYATAFGLAFMMPGPLVRQRYWEFRRETGRFSPRHLILMAHAFHVSVEAMCRRLEGFGLVPSGTWDSLKDRGFTGEAVRQVLGDGPETEERPVVPPRLWLLAAGAYQRGLLSEGQLARMLHMDRVEVREMLDALGAEEDDDLDAIAAD